MRRTIQFHGITFSRYVALDVDKMKFDIFVNRVLSADGDGQIIADVDGNI